MLLANRFSLQRGERSGGQSGVQKMDTARGLALRCRRGRRHHCKCAFIDYALGADPLSSSIPLLSHQQDHVLVQRTGARRPQALLANLDTRPKHSRDNNLKPAYNNHISHSDFLATANTNIQLEQVCISCVGVMPSQCLSLSPRRHPEAMRSQTDLAQNRNKKHPIT